MIPWLMSAALGFVKGWAIGPAYQQHELNGFDAEKDVYAPVKEELLYRAAPLSLFPGLPYGATAVPFAVDHALDMMKAGQPSAGELTARLGEVLLGGVLYEQAMREHGVLAAIGCHVLHNAMCTAGVQARRALWL